MNPTSASERTRSTSGRPVDVIYLLGLPHSGTTLLGNLLGEFDGCVSVGELCFLWRQLSRPAARCGCGRPLSECSFWRSVLSEALGEPEDAHGWAQLNHRVLVARHLLSVLLWTHGRGARADAVRSYRATLATLYQAVARSANSAVVIDSSKAPAVALLLSGVPGIRLHLVHVVRDSRANLSSDAWRPAPDLPRHTKLLAWDFWHLFCELRWAGRGRYLRIRYEDLADDPGAVLARVLAFVDHPGTGSPMLANDTAQLRVHHTVEGNRNRFTTGAVRIARDRRHERRLSVSDRVLAACLTGPLLLRHGYLRPGRGRGRAA